MKTFFAKLRQFNIVVALALLVQGIAMLVLSNDFSLPVTSSFLRYNPISNALNPTMEIMTKLRIGPMVSVFLLLSSLALFIVAAPKVYEWYVSNLKKGINYARWMEYSVTSSLMIVVIAMLVGIYDIASLILVFALNTAMIFFGWMMELHNQTTQKTDWTAFVFGSFAGIVPWVVIAIYLAGSGGNGGQVPSFVYWIFVSLFLFFNIFALNMVLQYKKIDPWKNYLFGERVYIVLSLVAKSLLAWQVFFGTLRPM